MLGIPPATGVITVLTELSETVPKSHPISRLGLNPKESDTEEAIVTRNWLPFARGEDGINLTSLFPLSTDRVPEMELFTSSPKLLRSILTLRPLEREDAFISRSKTALISPEGLAWRPEGFFPPFGAAGSKDCQSLNRTVFVFELRGLSFPLWSFMLLAETLRDPPADKGTGSVNFTVLDPLSKESEAPLNDRVVPRGDSIVQFPNV